MIAGVCLCFYCWRYSDAIVSFLIQTLTTELVYWPTQSTDTSALLFKQLYTTNPEWM